jgi:hypothetical protein
MAAQSCCAPRTRPRETAWCAPAASWFAHDGLEYFASPQARHGAWIQNRENNPMQSRKGDVFTRFFVT